MPGVFGALASTVALFTLSVIPAHTQSTQPHQIDVEISGLHSDKGQIRCEIFASSDGFPKDSGKAVARTSATISDRHASCGFDNLAPGTYAISVFHDENGNGKLDTNFIGMPREGVGSSNNVKPHFGPPKFKDAAFPFAGSPLRIDIKIIYL
jgi:uncharacterized protein (DUF2141 family)